MKKNQTDDFKRYKKMLTESRVSMPWPDLEDEVMYEIEQIETMEEQVSQAYRKGLSWSWFFFIVGIICGLILTYIIPQFTIGFEGAGDLFTILFQAGFVIFVLFQIENLIALGKKARSQTG
jgi:hypothetical protein